MNNYKLVPVEPTVEMLVAGKYALEAGCHASVIYADMIAAAPTVQGEPVGFCEDTSLSLAERTFSIEVDDQLAEDIIQYARRLYNLYAVPTVPAAQLEPVGWQFYQDGKWWFGDDRIKDHRKNTEEAGYPVRDVYAAPQPVPEVSALVEAMESLMKGYESLLEGGIDRITNMWTGNCDSIPDMLRDARTALAVYHEGSKP